MHLALADLSTRARKPWDGMKRSPAEPLGIAADARWIWHEIGHVLLTTSVGELQFRFAHSPGDALAAIVSDPESELATDPNWRGSTFPWVFLPRRHDRCVAVGWSWGGTMHYALSQVPNSAGRVAKPIGASRSFPRLCSACTGASVATRQWWRCRRTPDSACPQIRIALLRLPHHAGNPDTRYFVGRPRK